jgi:hypothetical protein
MSTSRVPQGPVYDGARRESSAVGPMTPLRDLVREGQELRRAFDAQTARMRVITSDDMKIRSR